MSPHSQRGPRAARGEIKERLLDAARDHFSRTSFAQVTLRDIAADAGVDPALISYYFSGKTGLFREAMSLPRDPGATVLAAIGDSLDGAAERVLKVMFEQWNLATSSETASKLLAESLLESSDTLDTFRSWLDEEIISPVARKLDGTNRRARATAGVGTIFQLISLRYLIKLEPIASMPEAEAIALYAPILQRLLTPTR